MRGQGRATESGRFEKSCGSRPASGRDPVRRDGRGSRSASARGSGTRTPPPLDPLDPCVHRLRRLVRPAGHKRLEKRGEPRAGLGPGRRRPHRACRTSDSSPRRCARRSARGSARGSPRPCRPRRGLSVWDHPHESLQNPKMKAAPALSGRSRESPSTSDPCRSQRLPSHPWPGGAKRRSLRAPVAQAVPETVVASTTVYQRVPALPRSSHRSPGFLHGWRLDDPCRTTSVVRSNRDQARQGAIA